MIIDEDQSSVGAFRHAMSAPGQSAAQAWAASNEFVRNEIGVARDLEGKGQHEQALGHLGNAMHTMQDSTSPAHMGFQEWDEHESGWSKATHVGREAYDPGAGSALDAAARRAYDIFRSRGPIPKEILARP